MKAYTIDSKERTWQVFTAGIHAKLNLSQLIAVILRPLRMKSGLVHVDGHFCSFFDIGIMLLAVNGGYVAGVSAAYETSVQYSSNFVKTVD